MKIKKVLFILPAIISLVACNNANNGGDNPPPSNKTTILHGVGVPQNSLGNNYDHYFDESTKLVWEKNDGVWFNKFAEASSALYARPNTKLKRSISDDDRTKLINALATSFYTTNGTVDVECQYPGSDYVWSYSAAFSKQNICLTSHWSVNPEEDTVEYYRIDEEGKLYSKNESGSYDLVDNDNIYCIVPHSCVETIIYDNFLMYDDDFGYLTGIIAGNINQFKYDSSTGIYSADEIEVSHGPITSYYVHEPASDEMKIAYSFQLSQDGNYVETAEFTILEGIETAGIIGMRTIFRFSNIHSTVVE